MIIFQNPVVQVKVFDPLSWGSHHHPPHQMHPNATLPNDRWSRKVKSHHESPLSVAVSWVPWLEALSGDLLHWWWRHGLRQRGECETHGSGLCPGRYGGYLASFVLTFWKFVDDMMMVMSETHGNSIVNHVFIGCLLGHHYSPIWGVWYDLWVLGWLIHC